MASGGLQRGSFLLRGVLLCVLAGAGLWSAPARGAEQYERFLDGLRSKRLYDLALDYLAIMRDSPLLTDDQRQLLPLQEGRTLVEQAQTTFDPAIRTRLLDAARLKLDEFVTAFPMRDEAIEARIQLASVVRERGRTVFENSKKSAAAEAAPLVEEARQLFTQAEEQFTAAYELIKTQYNALPKFIPEDQRDLIAKRDKLRALGVQCMIWQAECSMLRGKTYPADSQEFKDLVGAAGEAFTKVYEKYRKLKAGLIAMIFAGQCRQDLGDFPRALAAYEGVLVQPDADPDLRALIASALRRSMECWLHDSLKKYEEIINRGMPFLEKANVQELRTTEFVGVQYYVALACKLTADALPDDDPTKKDRLSFARRLATDAARQETEFEERAKELLAQLGAAGSDGAEPTDFITAAERAQMEAEAYQIAKETLASPPEGADASALQQEVASHQAAALQYANLALALREPETSIDDVNRVRYILCLMFYQQGDFYRAAVLGEFLARKYPEGAVARPSARVAMASYLEAYKQGPQESAFERSRMQGIAEHITTRWPDDSGADEAWDVLITLAIGEGDVAAARQYLDQMKPESPVRVADEMKVGRALWAQYLDGSRKEEGERPPQAELDQFAADAQALLEKGFAPLQQSVAQGAAPTNTFVTSSLALGQIYVNLGQTDKLVPLLEDPASGLLTLVRANNPATQNPATLKTDIYKLALRAYVGMQALDKAQTAMDELEALVAGGGDAAAAETLTKIYIALGRELEDQLAILGQGGQEEELQRVSQGFELFLDRIRTRQTGNTFGSLNWVASTFASLAGGFDKPGPSVPEKARGYYERAVATDETILQRAAAESGFASENSAIAVRLRLARSLRRVGRFEDSIAQLLLIIQAKPALLEAQREAALTYMEWGSTDPKMFLLANRGDKPIQGENGRQKNQIWGWAMMSQALQARPEFAAAWADARYNLCETWYLHATAAGVAAADQKKLLKLAARDIGLTMQIRADFGGGDWRERFDKLLRRVQQAAGEQVQGLQVFEQAQPAAQAATGS